MAVLVTAALARRVRSALPLGVAACLLAVPALAAEWQGATGDVDPEADARDTAKVKFDGELVGQVARISSLPPAERALRIAERIRAVADDASFPSSALAVDDGEHGSAVTAGERRIMVVTDVDAADMRLPRAALARVYRDRIKEVVDGYRAARTPRAVARAVGASAAAIAAVAVFLALARKGRRRLHDLLERKLAARVGTVKFRSIDIVDPGRVAWLLRSGMRTAELAVGLVAVVIGAEFVLGRLPWTRGFASDLLPYLLAPVHSIGAGLFRALPDLLFLAVLVVLTRWLLKVTRIFFLALESGTLSMSGFEREWALPTYRIVRLLIVALAAVTAYPHVPGSETGAFKGISILAGLVLSLGSSAAVANVIAGYSLIYRRPFQIGDRVKIGDLTGTVEEIRVAQTRLRTPKNEIAVLPNSAIVSGEVLNYSALARRGGVLLHTTVGIGYETPWRQVEAMLRLAADRTAGIAKAPAPFVLETLLGDFCVTYELNAACEDPTRMEDVYAALHRSVLDVFNEHGVQIMTPAYIADPAAPKVVPREQWYERPAEPPAAAAADAAPEPPLVGARAAERG